VFTGTPVLCPFDAEIDKFYLSGVAQEQDDIGASLVTGAQLYSVRQILKLGY
jgi:hypothetical protein